MPSAKLDYPIIVHSHLRWDGVWQRPQQFLSRLSVKHRVLFAEGPVLVDEEITPRYELHEVSDYPNVTVLQTYFPKSRFQDGAWVDGERQRLLTEVINGPLAGEFNHPVQWFYDPMAAPAFVGKMNESAVVYDCMDQLSQFKFAPPEIIHRELHLLMDADVVFCGGRKLWESKSEHNHNCHFYGCGVEVDHFGKARSAETQIPNDVDFVNRPILGYFGVVDERMDYELVEKLADANPNWNVVIIGPVCKVDTNTLPCRPNLYWVGRREYPHLPAYTKAFDVCLMPFALNEATEYINPTKALEYMATGRQIVSTAVPDVVSNFNKVVMVAESHQEFIQFCKDAVASPNGDLIEAGLAMACANTWDCIVSRLDEHVREALKRKATHRTPARETETLVAVETF
ncbi:MAG: glycosyltransferase [Verrucomicrobia bacterium]|nr:glycosyltransferase [Verrucomicrobiota bacterium]